MSSFHKCLQCCKDKEGVEDVALSTRMRPLTGFQTILICIKRKRKETSFSSFITTVLQSDLLFCYEFLISDVV